MSPFAGLLITVTPNAAIDRTVELARLDDDPAAHALADDWQAGGKGLNVARATRTLGPGRVVRAVGVVGGRAGERLCQELEESGLPFRPVWAAGETRTCLECVERGSGRVRQEHEPGVLADHQVAEKLLQIVDDELSAARVGSGSSSGSECWIAVCGSLARGLPDDTVARLVALARERGVRCAIDTSGAALPAAWRADPDLLRINRGEAASALGRSAESLGPPPYPGMSETGPAFGVVSDGARPFFAWERARNEKGRVWRIVPPGVSLRNPIGCGDSMLAGLLAALSDGREFADALRSATAIAAAEAESPRAGRPDPRRAAALAHEVALSVL